MDFSTTVHVIVDGLGNPLRVLLTAGQRHDILLAPALLDELHVTRVIAYSGYAGHAVVNLVLANVAEVVIPPHQHAKQQRGIQVKAKVKNPTTTTPIKLLSTPTP